ncbi:MAG: tRNA pseudouridine(13) synthase TruD [Planctomycetota bacterium]
MKIKRKPEDYLVEEVLELPVGETGRHAVYLLEKRSLNTLDALAALTRRVNLPKDAAGFAGLKDRHSLSRQYVSLPGGPAGHLQGRGFSARFLGHADRPVSTALLRGNRFQIVVRDLTRAQAKHFAEETRLASRTGWPNYFDEQRFGSARHGKGFIAERMAKGDFESALRLFMATPARKDSAHRKGICRKAASLWDRWDSLAKALPPGTERRIASHLAKTPKDFPGALDLIDRQLMSLFLHAWQSLLWNRIVSRVLENDPAIQGRFHRPYKFGRFLFFKGIEEMERERLHSLRIPLPGPSVTFTSDRVQAAFEEVLSEFELSREHFRLKGVRAFFKGGDRNLLVFPSELHVGNPQPDELDPGRRKLRFSMGLPPGSYATILIKRASVFPG